MNKKLLILLVIAAVVGATGIASARMSGQDGYYAQQNGNSDWANQMYQWMGQHMGRWGGQMMGYGQYADSDAILVTQEEAVHLIEDAVDGKLTSEVYQMGRWFVASYEDDEEITKQARVDIVTGEVYVDFNTYMSENVNFNSGLGGFRGPDNGAGCVVWG